MEVCAIRAWQPGAAAVIRPLQSIRSLVLQAPPRPSASNYVRAQATSCEVDSCTRMLTRDHGSTLVEHNLVGYKPKIVHLPVSTTRRARLSTDPDCCTMRLWSVHPQYWGLVVSGLHFDGTCPDLVIESLLPPPCSSLSMHLLPN